MTQSHKANHNSADIPFRLAVSSSQVFFIAFSSNLKKLKVTILNSANGQKLDQITLSSDEVSSLDDVLVVARSKSPVIVWSDAQRKSIKINVLGTKTTSSFSTSSGSGETVESIQIYSPNVVTAKPHFLVHYQAAQNHWGEVFHVTGTEAKPTVEKAYDIARLSGHGAFAASTYQDKIYFTRVAQGAFLALDSDENNIVDRYPMQDFGIAGVLDNPQPILAIAEVNPRLPSAKFAIRAATLFTTGDWNLLLNGEASWIRPEGLAYITAAAFADLSKKQSLAHELEVEVHSTVIQAYIHRVQRHIKDLQKLPDIIQALPEKIINSLLGKGPESNNDDTFGFRKHVVVATESGRLVALDTSSFGRVVWSTQIPGFEKGQVPQITASTSGIVRVKTETSHSVFDTATGKFLRKGTESGSSKGVSTSATTIKFKSSPTVVSGYLGDVHSNDSPLWTFYPQHDEEIINVIMSPSFDPVAVIGDVLGDRRVQYKYLNPNLVLITAVSTASSSVTFYLLDGVSGNTIHTITQGQVDITQPIPTLLAENMFTYSLTLSNAPSLASRGYLLGVSKFYESPLADDRGSLGADKTFSVLDSNSTGALSPNILSQTYHIPEPISSLSISRTSQGITSRLILANLPFSGALLSIPLAILDPRRPVGRAPTKDEQAEGLMPYVPNLEFDPKWYLSHSRDIRGLETIIAAPSGMESTGLVFAYGGDVFGTKVTPSGAFDVLGDGFAKGNMVVTVVAVMGLVLVVAPIVGKKTNNVRWSVPL
jgi:ER membrane protein complex subunit 1